MDGLETAVDDVKDATSTLADDLERARPAGHRGGRGGEGVARRRSRTTSSGEVETIESALDDVSGASDVLTAVSTVSAGARRRWANQVATTFTGSSELDAEGELEDAFREADSCDDLTDSFVLDGVARSAQRNRDGEVSYVPVRYQVVPGSIAA